MPMIYHYGLFLITVFLQIPEKYFPSCVKYLGGIQGNTREVRRTVYH